MHPHASPVTACMHRSWFHNESNNTACTSEKYVRPQPGGWAINYAYSIWVYRSFCMVGKYGCWNLKAEINTHSHLRRLDCLICSQAVVAPQYAICWRKHVYNIDLYALYKVSIHWRGCCGDIVICFKLLQQSFSILVGCWAIFWTTVQLILDVTTHLV